MENNLKKTIKYNKETGRFTLSNYYTAYYFIKDNSKRELLKILIEIMDEEFPKISDTFQKIKFGKTYKLLLDQYQKLCES